MARGAASSGPRHDDLKGMAADPSVKQRFAGRAPNVPVDARGVRYPSRHAPRHTYLTTDELAKELRLAPQQIHRWCRAWFGPLPDGRAAKGQGYRIPKEYRYVARFWKAVQDPHDRNQAWKALVDEPRPWVVVAGPHVSTHNTAGEVATRIDNLLHSSASRERVVTLYVGPMNEE